MLLGSDSGSEGFVAYTTLNLLMDGSLVSGGMGLDATR